MSIAISVFLVIVVFGALLYCVRYKKPIIVHCPSCKTRVNYLTKGICQECYYEQRAQGVSLK